MDVEYSALLHAMAPMIISRLNVLELILVADCFWHFRVKDEPLFLKLAVRSSVLASKFRQEAIRDLFVSFLRLVSDPNVWWTASLA